jgi:hypothetical protein
MRAGFLNCSLPVCGNALKPPILQCSKCHAVAYCSRACQVKTWKAGHKREHEQIQCPQLQHQRRRRHRPQFHPKNMNWSSKRNERIGSVLYHLSVPFSPVVEFTRGPTIMIYQLLCLRLTPRMDAGHSPPRSRLKSFKTRST